MTSSTPSCTPTTTPRSTPTTTPMASPERAGSTTPPSTVSPESAGSTPSTASTTTRTDPPRRDRVLVVDDEPQMLAIIEYILDKAEFDVVTAGDAETATTLIRHQAFDCAILDVMLPQASGLSLCRRIRETSTMPVMFLSALTAAEERVEGFEAGADDYIVKPFNARELVLRTQAVLGRYHNHDSEQAVTNGPVRLYARSLAVVHGSRRVLVSEHEMRLLVELARHLDQPVGWRDLIAAVWHTEALTSGKEMLKTTVHRLRLKLGQELSTLVVAVRGRGYVMPSFGNR